MNKISFILSLTVATGCALTNPKGEKQITPLIEADKQAEDSSKMIHGRPIFVEAYSYPQILESGDLWGGGSIFLNIGREELSLEAFLKKK